MSARDWSGLREAASMVPDVIEHEGDCASSLCHVCGHCLHSITECKCQACGCGDYSESDDVRFRRDVLAALDELAAARAALARVEAIAEEWDEIGDRLRFMPSECAVDLRAALDAEADG